MLDFDVTTHEDRFIVSPVTTRAKAILNAKFKTQAGIRLSEQGLINFKKEVDYQYGKVIFPKAFEALITIRPSAPVKVEKEPVVTKRDYKGKRLRLRK